MARFQRTTPPPMLAAKKNYSAYRPYVRLDFAACCAYCLRHEDWAEAETFELDHFRPKSRFPKHKYDFYNLYYSCRRCNLRKLDHWPSAQLLAAGIQFVDFCSDDFDAQFTLDAEGIWQPLTESARYTLRILRLNSDALVRQRLLLLRNGYAIYKPAPSA